MSLPDPTIDVLELALRRSPFLDCLSGEVMDKRALVGELECSRSTVNRGIRELEALDLIEYADGGYRITPLGEEVAAGFTEVAETVELRLEFDPFLQWMPDEEFGLDLELLRDAELVVPKSGDPYRVINRHINRLKRMEEGYFLLPFAGGHAIETAHDRVIRHGAECEVIVTQTVAYMFQEDQNYVKTVTEMIEADCVNIFRAKAEMPFALGVIDERVQIIVEESEEPRALVETDSDEVRSWAKDVYGEYKAEAEPLRIPAESPEIRS